MSLIGILIVVVIIGVVESMAPMDQPWKNLVRLLGVIIVLVLLLEVLSGYTGHPIHIP